MPTLAHHYLLLEVEEGRGTPRSGEPGIRWWGLAGALWGEMQLRGRVIAVKADRFALAQGPISEGALGYAETCIQGRAARGQAWRLRQIYTYAPRLRKMVLEELVELGALRKEKDTVLRIPWRTRWPAADGALEVELVDHMRTWLAGVSNEDPPDREDLLLGLLRGTGNLESLWTAAEISQLKPLIEERTARAPLGLLVRDLCRQGADMAPYRKRDPK